MHRNLIRLVGLAAIAALPAAAHAAGHRLECPAQAPSSWGLRLGPLSQVAVLSQKTGVAIDDSAPPTLVPDRGFARGNAWHNLWDMDDEPGWSHFIQCQYRGSPRVLRLPADGLKRCEQTASPYTVAKGVADDAVHALVCD